MALGQRDRHIVTDASVNVRGRQIGAVSWIESREIGVFQYAQEFVGSSIELAPPMMPLDAARLVSAGPEA